MAALPLAISPKAWMSPTQWWTVIDPNVSLMWVLFDTDQQFTTEANLANLCVIQGLSWFSAFNEQDEWRVQQGDLPDGEPYTVVKDIPVKVIQDGSLDFIATFEDANISIGGINKRDAFQALVYEILDLFDYLTANHDTLGPEPQRQLAVLSGHLVKVNG